MDKLILADIQALAASPDYGGQGLITSASAALGLSAAAFLSNLDLWQGAGYELTQGEVDDIEAMIAQLENDLMLAGDMYPQYRCRLTWADHYILANDTYEYVEWPQEVYDPENMYDYAVHPNWVTAPVAGLYEIDLVFAWGYYSLGIRRVFLAKWPLGEGVTYIAEDIDQNPKNTSQCYTFTHWTDIAGAGDRYMAVVYQNSGGPITMVAGPRSPFFSMFKV